MLLASLAPIAAASVIIGEQLEEVLVAAQLGRVSIPGLTREVSKTGCRVRSIAKG